VRFLTNLAALIAGAALAFAVSSVMKQPSRQSGAPEKAQLALAVGCIEKRLDQYRATITANCRGVARAVASDYGFSMKLLVENDRSAPEVSEAAQRYIEAAGLSLLEITTADYELLSCGHFPAAAGSSVEATGAKTGPDPVFIREKLRGEEALTLQAKIAFDISGTTLYCIGGLIIDDAFIASLAPSGRISVLLKSGADVSGRTGVSSISDITDSVMTLNDVPYYAASVSLPYAGDGEAPELLVLVEKPQR